MNTAIKIRFIGLGLAMAAMVGLIVWTAHTSWQRVSELRNKLTSVNLESFVIAEHFEKSLVDLNNRLLAYDVKHEAGDWEAFLKESDDLNKWIDLQMDNCRSEVERGLIHQLDVAYDDYLAAATNFDISVRSTQRPSGTLAEYASVKRESDKLLQLGIQLASAHRESLDNFISESIQSLDHLRAALFGSLILLLLCGAGLGFVIFRDMIAPLRVKLVESKALLERHEKLAALGLLAAGVAHEIRNPLTAIKARLFTQQKVLRPGTPEAADATVIGQEINRLERIVKDFLLFARPSEPEWQVLPAGQSLREVHALFAAQFEQAGIRLNIEDSTGPDGARIRVDPQQIKQVLINLVQNAAESIVQDGSITLRARLDTRRLSSQPRPVVVLEIADTGKGIPAEVEKRLFDPFFTTKDAGTGLGLCIAARIVEKHGGALQYQTQVGRGTTFGIVLPRVESA